MTWPLARAAICIPVAGTPASGWTPTLWTRSFRGSARDAECQSPSRPGACIEPTSSDASRRWPRVDQAGARNVDAPANTRRPGRAACSVVKARVCAERRLQRTRWVTSRTAVDSPAAQVHGQRAREGRDGDDQYRSGRLLLLGKGAVVKQRVGAPVAAGSDESEQSPGARGANVLAAPFQRMRASSPVCSSRPLGTSLEHPGSRRRDARFARATASDRLARRPQQAHPERRLTPASREMRPSVAKSARRLQDTMLASRCSPRAHASVAMVKQESARGRSARTEVVPWERLPRRGEGDGCRLSTR